MKEKKRFGWIMPILSITLIMSFASCTHQDEVVTNDDSAEAASLEVVSTDTSSGPEATGGITEGPPDVALGSNESIGGGTTDGAETTDSSTSSESNANSLDPDSQDTSTTTEDGLMATASSVETTPPALVVSPETAEDLSTTNTSEATPDTAAESDATNKPRAPASHSPKIPKSAIKKGEQVLNRYYFLRRGDTPEHVSQIIYGSIEYAKMLTSWNSQLDKWEPGETVYYRSPNDPKDSQMASFLSESGILASEYVIESGDSLSKIALQKYGHLMSWKEIAAVNDLQHPDKIVPGMKLALYDLKSMDTHMAKNSVAPMAAPPTEEGLGLEDEIGESLKPEAAEVVPKKEEEKLASMEVTNFIKQNWLVIGVALILFIGLIFTVFARRRSQWGNP